MSATIIVSGMVGGTPGQGGATWAVLQHLLGLRALGHDVFLVEPVGSGEVPISASATWCDRALAPVGLGDRWCVIGPDGKTEGMSRTALRATARRADVLLNVSGMLTDDDVLAEVPVRVYLDLDPAFVQLWHLGGIDMRLDAHTHFVSVSDAIGKTIPDCGRRWISTLPPVVLDQWPLAERVEHDALTTVANWRGYGSIEHEGAHYGQKAHSVRPLFDLPRHVAKRIALALAIHPGETADLAALREHGWDLLDPALASTPEGYRAFVQGSWAELGIAKSGYVVSDSGWFSDRSACYLASGRPVVAQDTGFGRRLPTGAGLFAFAGVDDVVAAVGELEADYDRHRRAARAVAEEHLAADRVLTRLLDRVLA